MEWKARFIVPFVTAFVLLTAAVVLAILRLGGVIAWPARWVVLVLLVVLLAPIALLFMASAAQAEQRSEPNSILDWISNLFWWS